MIATRSVRRGTTLVELMVVIAILGVVAAVTAIAIRAPASPPGDDRIAALSAAREEAIRTRRAVTVVTSVAGYALAATAYPDGRVLAEGETGIDALSGRDIHAR